METEVFESPASLKGQTLTIKTFHIREPSTIITFVVTVIPSEHVLIVKRRHYNPDKPDKVYFRVHNVHDLTLDGGDFGTYFSSDMYPREAYDAFKAFVKRQLMLVPTSKS